MWDRISTHVDHERLTKQPLWVHDMVAGLIRDREAAEKAAHDARLATNPDETNTLIDPYGKPPVGLPNDTSVRFRLTGDEYVDCRIKDGELHIMGSSTLKITPNVSNVVTVSTEGRFA